MDSKHTYQPSYADTNSASSSSSSTNNNGSTEPTTSPFANSKDVVTDTATPPPYTRYAGYAAEEQSHRPQAPAELPRQPPTQPQQPQQFDSAPYQSADPRQLQQQQQPQDYGYQMDQQPPAQVYRNHIDQLGDYGYGRYGNRGPIDGRRGMGMGMPHTMRDERLWNQQQHGMYGPQLGPGYGYGYDDYYLDRHGRRRRRGYRERRGPLHLLFNEVRRL